MVEAKHNQTYILYEGMHKVVLSFNFNVCTAFFFFLGKCYNITTATKKQTPAATYADKC